MFDIELSKHISITLESILNKNDIICNIASSNLEIDYKESIDLSNHFYQYFNTFRSTK